MNTATTARRVSEGTATAQVINAMPRPYLLDTTTLHDSRAVLVAGHIEQRKATQPRKPLRLIKPAPTSAACGFGTCALSPDCTSRCRYREADEALRGHHSSRHTQRADMPKVGSTKVDRRLRAITWRALTAFCVLYLVAIAAWMAW